MSELIQCELCDIFVNFDDYLEHSRECSLEFENPLTASCLTFSYTTNNDDEEFNEFEEEDEDIEEEEEEEEDDEEYSFLSNNNANPNININFQNQNPLDMNINSIAEILNLGNMHININMNNLRTIYDLDTYENYSNLEDVKTPVKNIEKVAPLINDSDIPEETYCTICQEYLLKPVRKTLCNHYFCSKCIEPWLTEMNNTCPNCSYDLE